MPLFDSFLICKKKYRFYRDSNAGYKDFPDFGPSRLSPFFPGYFRTLGAGRYTIEPQWQRPEKPSHGEMFHKVI